MMPIMNLLQTTLRLLKETGYKLPYISKATGITIPWLASFKRQNCKEYGVKKVQALHDFLAHGIRAQKDQPAQETPQETASASQ